MISGREATLMVFERKKRLVWIFVGIPFVVLGYFLVNWILGFEGWVSVVLLFAFSPILLLAGASASIGIPLAICEEVQSWFSRKKV